MKRLENIALITALLCAMVFSLPAKSFAATELSVFAAASMTESMNKIADMYKKVAPDVKIVYNFDSSGTLKTQIEQGAGYFGILVWVYLGSVPLRGSLCAWETQEQRNWLLGACLLVSSTAAIRRLVMIMVLVSWMTESYSDGAVMASRLEIVE